MKRNDYLYLDHAATTPMRESALEAFKNAEEFAKFLLTDFSINNESVMLAPAAGFYSSNDNGKDEVRIAFVLNSEKIKRAINIINIGLKEYIG